MTQFDTKIQSIAELVAPASENAFLKSITQGIYKTFEEVDESINHHEGYISLVRKSLTIAPEDFGISALRLAIKRRDAEDVLNRIKTLLKMIDLTKEGLKPIGLTDERIANFDAARVKITADKKQQYAILKNRAAIVQNNMGQLNDLFEQMQDIMKIGKILFGKTDPAKTKEYTFSTLVKQVRHTMKKSNDEPQGGTPSEDSSHQ